MSDEEKPFSLMAIAEEHQAAAQHAIEGLVVAQVDFTQQIAASAKLICYLVTPEAAAGAMELDTGA